MVYFIKLRILAIFTLFTIHTTYAQDNLPKIDDHNINNYSTQLTPGFQSTCTTKEIIKEKKSWFPTKNTKKGTTRTSTSEGVNYFETEAWSELLYIRLKFLVTNQGLINFSSQPIFETNFNKELIEGNEFQTISTALKNSASIILTGRLFESNKPTEQNYCNVLGGRQSGQIEGGIKPIGITTDKQRRALVLVENQTISCYFGDSYTIKSTGWTTIDLESGLMLSSKGKLTIEIRNEEISTSEYESECKIEKL